MASEPQLGRLYYETWLEEVAPLLSREERRAFRALASDSEREDFIQFFWQARETSDGSGRGFWTQNMLHASRAYGDLVDDRVRVLLLLGPPSFEVSFACSWVLVETRIFFYAAGVDREGLYVPFVRDDDETGAHRLWRSSEGILSLVRPPSQKTSTEERAQRYRLGSETASRKTGIAERYRRKQGGSDAVRLDTMIEMIAEGEICPADDTSDPRRRLGLLRAALESDLDWGDLRERSEVGAARPGWLDSQQHWHRSRRC